MKKKLKLKKKKLKLAPFESAPPNRTRLEVEASNPTHTSDQPKRLSKKLSRPKKQKKKQSRIKCHIKKIAGMQNNVKMKMMLIFIAAQI
jgi:hypothetical protein